MRKPLIVVAALFAFVPQLPAAAWHDSAHRTIAAVSYRRLPPPMRQRIAAVLRQHPHFASRWRPGLAASGVAPDLHLFMQAACWPDTVRGDTRYDRPAWHLMSKVYSPDGTAFRSTAAENTLTALELNKQRFIAPESKPADQAIALCWVMHLLGDLHQPFRAVTRATAAYPTGDRGGLDAWVGTPSGPQNLHELWEGLFDAARTPGEANALSGQLIAARPPTSLMELETRSPSLWAEESVRLSVAAGYHHVKDVARPYDRIPLAISKVREAAPPVPDGYLANARANAERRVTLAGYRLARVVGGLMYGQR